LWLSWFFSWKRIKKFRDLWGLDYMHHVGHVKQRRVLVSQWEAKRQVVVFAKMMLGQVVKVQKERIAACMTCPLCNKLFREATTISECLHTCESLSRFLYVCLSCVIPFSFCFLIWAFNC
jgi:hypothetical protein